MKICDITFLYFPRGGGIKTYIDSKNREYEKRGIEHVIIGPNEGKEAGVVKKKRGTTTLYKIASREIRSRGIIMYMFRHFSDIGTILEDERPDVLEIGDKMTTFFYGKKIRKMCRKIGIRVFVFSHERADNFIAEEYKLNRGGCVAWIQRLYLNPFRRALMRRFVGAADAVVCNSEFTAQEVRPITKKPVHILRLGIQKEGFSKEKHFSNALYNQISCNGKKKVLIHVGRIDEDKKIGLLKEIVRKMDAKKFTLLLVGDGPEAEFFKKSKKVHFAGYVGEKDVRRYLAVSDLGILVNDIEPFGLVALEMMAMELPILGPNAGGLSGILEKGFSWKLPYDAQAYLLAMDEWYGVKNSEALGKKAREIFLKKYTSEAIVRNLLKIYKA